MAANLIGLGSWSRRVRQLVQVGVAAGPGRCGSCSRWVRQLVQVGVAGPVGCETGIFGCGRCS